MEKRTLLGLFAHPDDESFGPGGTLARYAAEGADVHVIIATDGDAGSVEENHKREDGRTLAQVRGEELAKAVIALGITSVWNLPYRDSGMRGSADNEHPRSLIQQPVESLTAELVDYIRRLRPQVILTHDPFGGYGHPDHIAAAKIARRAWEVAGDPTWRPSAGPAWLPKKLYEVRIPDSQRDAVLALLESRGIESWWSEPKDVTAEELEKWRAWRAMMACPDEIITTRIDIRNQLGAKRRAIQAHATQIKSDGPLLLLSEDDQIALGAREQYRLLAHRLDVAPALPEKDLFAGLR